jgi:hypothetical protein
LILKVLAFVLGFLLVAAALRSAVRIFVLPRSAGDLIAQIVFRGVRFFYNQRLRLSRSYLETDRILAYYAPVGLIMLLPAWLVCVLLGYTGMYWALSGMTPYEAFRLSGSSLLTLGSFSPDGIISSLLEFTEATIGLILVALLISYLPTIYAAFSRRETAVTLLEVRAGSPPSAIEMILRYHRIHGLNRLNEVWSGWETWFADIEESHSSLSALVFYRSPSPEHSWVTASGAVLDAASLVLSAVDVPHDPQADLCIRAGYLALRKIADFFQIQYDPNPRPMDPISVSRAEFEEAVKQLQEGGVPIKADPEQAWHDFNGWRVNYDKALLGLARLTAAPASPWTGDRPVQPHLSQAFRSKQK